MMSEPSLSPDAKYRSLSLSQWISLSSALEAQQNNHGPDSAQAPNPSDIAVSSDQNYIPAKTNDAQSSYVEQATRVMSYLVDCLQLLPENCTKDGASDSSSTVQSENNQTVALSDALEVDFFCVQLDCEAIGDCLSAVDNLSALDDSLKIKDMASSLPANDLSLIVNSVGKVKLAGSFQNAVLNEKSLPRVFFQKLGIIFHKICSRGEAISLEPEMKKSVSPHGSAPNTETSIEKTIESIESDEEGDEEQPGSEKGRRKYSLRRTCKSFRRISLSDIEDPLLEKGIPMEICRLITHLIELDGNHEHSFQTLNEVASEINNCIIQCSASPMEKASFQSGNLKFGDKIYGRTEATCNLLRAAATMTHLESDPPKNDVVLIGGNSGTGKSFLVQSVQKPLMESGWVFIGCKFDRSNQQSVATITSAFDDFFGLIEKMISDVQHAENEEMMENAEYARTILSSVERLLSASGIINLSESIPSLRRLYPGIFQRLVHESPCDTKHVDNHTGSDGVDVLEKDDDISGAETMRNRQNYLLRKMARAIAQEDNPVLFFVDDIQWADQASLDVLSSLILEYDYEIGSKPLLIVGSFRSNEIDSTHILAHHLQEFEISSSVRLTKIHLDGMSKASTNVMIAEVLNLPVRFTRSFTDVVHNKTLGNPLFVRTFLQSLFDDKVLTYSLSKKRWMWDIEVVKVTSVDDDVAKLMARKIMRFPADAQEALKIASCFGLKVRKEASLALCDSDHYRKVMPSLDLALHENILEEHGPNIMFSHDMIREAAYGLIQQKDAGEYHFRIGAHLAACGEFNSKADLFVAIDQINRAKFFGTTDNSTLDHAACATLNLKAAERMIEVADFSSALSYVDFGVDFLGDQSWDSNYELALALHDAACLACYCSSSINLLSRFLEELLEHAKCLEDRLKGFYILIWTLASSGKVKDAMSKGFCILEQLGEEFPEIVPVSVANSALSSTKELLDCHSKNGDILNSQGMTDKSKLWAMRLMDLIMPYAFMVSPNHRALLSCRMVQLSIQYGLSKESAYGLVSYGYSQISTFQNIPEGYRWAKKAISMLERFKIKLPKVQSTIVRFISIWVEPFQSLQDVTLQCHQESLAAGDIEDASLSAQMYCDQSFIMSGRPLPLLEKECEKFASEMSARKQLHSQLPHACTHQTVLLLMDSKKDPFLPIKEFVSNEDELLSYALETRKSALSQYIYFHRFVIAYLYQQYEVAIEMANKYHCRKALRFQDIFVVFYEGLMAFHFARACQEDFGSSKWLEKGNDALATYERWLVNSEWNFENKKLALEAEYHFSLGDMQTAEEKYIASIQSARRHRFLHEEGITLQLFGEFCMKNGKREKGLEKLSDARECYEKWGASGLINHLDTIQQKN